MTTNTTPATMARLGHVKPRQTRKHEETEDEATGEVRRIVLGTVVGSCLRGTGVLPQRVPSTYSIDSIVVGMTRRRHPWDQAGSSIQLFLTIKCRNTHVVDRMHTNGARDGLHLVSLLHFLVFLSTTNK